MRESGDQIQRGCSRGLATGLQAFVPALGLVELDDVGITCSKIVEKAHAVGMVGDHQPVERAAQPDGWPLEAITSSPRAKR